jgi:hypothetical protein
MWVGRRETVGVRLKNMEGSLIALDDEGYRAVVDQGDGHVRLEDSGFYLRAAAGYCYEVLVQRTSLFSGRCVVEARTAAFAAIAVEGELGDD